VKKLLLLLGIILILGLLQVTVLNYFRIFLVKPDLLLISLVIISLYLGSLWQVLVFGVIIGMLKDVLSLNISSLNIILFPLWGLAIVKLSKKIVIDTDIIRGLLILIIVILNGVIVRLMYLPAGIVISSGIFFKILVLESLYTALVAPLLFKLIHPLILK